MLVFVKNKDGKALMPCKPSKARKLIEKIKLKLLTINHLLYNYCMGVVVPPFMNTLRKKVFAKYPEAKIVYGSWTTPKRKDLNLTKTHYNDAIAISGVEEGYKDITNLFKIKQFRKKKRSLHEAIPRKGRKFPNTTQKRNSKNTKERNGFYLNDEVKVFGKVAWISGFCKGGVYVKDINNNYITLPGKTYKQVSYKYLEKESHNNNWQFQILKSS